MTKKYIFCLKYELFGIKLIQIGKEDVFRLEEAVDTIYFYVAAKIEKLLMILRFWDTFF